jgi:uncharacterized protein YdhG (YjbR/CyaY superfamily)
MDFLLTCDTNILSPVPIRASRIPKKVSNYYLRVMLEMRSKILEIVPDAEEVISYGMPAFKVRGNIVAGILANKSHIGYYPFSGSVLHLFKKELSGFKTTKSAVHVPLTKSLSKSLIKKLIRARLSQCPITRGEVDLAKYTKLDSHWREIGLAAPARRGLVDIGLLNLSDLTKISEKELRGIHGMGPSAIKLIKREMKRSGLNLINSF